ncbi:hypothetical protein [Streptomyces sp. cg36]|uniref:hypothetical protein n=1 Tax=Streptomyces sp. cg36 TaxID=3238798 RepID=UPI0034E29DA2
MSVEPGSTLLKDQYAAQVGADLETNAKEQERIRGEIHTLNGRLVTLEGDHALLTTMQATLTGAQAAARIGAAAGPKASSKGKPAARVSRPRSSQRTKQDVPPTAATTPASPATTSPKRRASVEAPLRELVLALFTHQDPRSVADVQAELGAAHPQRTRPSAQLVRNTLEALVAKSHLSRSRVEGAVRYTALPAAPAGAPVQPTPSAGNAEAGA